jgi:hypothetical protein
MKLIRFANCVAIGLITSNLVLPSQLTSRWSGQLRDLGGEQGLSTAAHLGR